MSLIFALFTFFLVLTYMERLGERKFEYPQPSKYSNRVLVGPWVRDRENALPPIEEKHQHTSTYDTEYTQKTHTRREQDMTWNQIMQSELSLVIPEDGKDFYDNFSTLYDLSYTHFPKSFKSHIPREWHLVKSQHEPTNEYLPSFGNKTNFGLLKQKQVQWNYDRSDPRLPTSSSYDCEFRAPPNENYQFKRFFVPKTNLNKVDPEELEMFRQKRRFAATHNYVPSTLLGAFKSNFCNPITWECSPDMNRLENNRNKLG